MRGAKHYTRWAHFTQPHARRINLERFLIGLVFLLSPHSYTSSMALVHDRCICLRKVEYSETSQILLLFSREHGMQRVIAKGAHRRTKAGSSKFDGGADLLDVGEAVFTQRLEKDLGLLTEWSLREGHLSLRRNLRGMYLGLYAAELASLLFEEHDPHPAAFDQLEMMIPELTGPRVEEVFLIFQIDLLRESGYLPELSGCVNCGITLNGRNPVYFSPARGGVLCQNCQAVEPDRLSLDVRLLNMLQTILRLPKANGTIQRLPRLTRHQTDPINRLLASHMQQTLSKTLRMPPYILGN
jgi:DNA repair protein RecO (recombination protein O)